MYFCHPNKERKMLYRSLVFLLFSITTTLVRGQTTTLCTQVFPAPTGACNDLCTDPLSTCQEMPRSCCCGEQISFISNANLTFVPPQFPSRLSNHALLRLSPLPLPQPPPVFVKCSVPLTRRCVRMIQVFAVVVSLDS